MAGILPVQSARRDACYTNDSHSCYTIQGLCCTFSAKPHACNRVSKLKMTKKRKFFMSQLKALGCAELPEQVFVGKELFELRKIYKHSFAVAVGLYEKNEDRVIVKLHRQKHFFGIPLKWIGEFMARYESAVLKHCSGIKGVPQYRESALTTAVAHDYIPGDSLSSENNVNLRFFENLFHLLDRIHERGVAYVDMEKAENILKGTDELPYFFDFQLAFFWPDDMPLGQCTGVRLLRKWLQDCDRYHAYKHLRRMRPDLLSNEEYRFSLKKPWLVIVANAVFKPMQIARKALQKLRKIKDKRLINND